MRTFAAPPQPWAKTGIPIFTCLLLGHVPCLAAHYFSSVQRQLGQALVLELNGDPALVRFSRYYDFFIFEQSQDLCTWQPTTTLLGTNAVTNSLAFLVMPDKSA